METFFRKRVISQVSFFSVLTLTGILLFIYGTNIYKWGGFPDFGFGFRTATGVNVVGVLWDPGREAGLQIGDRILKTNGKSYSTYREFNEAKHWGIGEENTYLIERAGDQIEITIPNIRFGFKRAFNVSGLPFLCGFIYILIGTLVFFMKPHERTSWIFSLFATVVGLFMAFLYKAGVIGPPWFENVIILTYCFLPATIFHMAINFPEERNFVKKYPYSQLLPYIVAGIIFLQIRSVTPTMLDAPKSWVTAAVLYLAFSLFFLIGSCLQLRLTSSSMITRLRARVILLGFAIACSLPIVDFVINTLFQVYIVPGFNYYLPFFIVVPLAIGYAIIKHDLFDIDAIIKRTYGYVLTTATIAGIYGIVVLLSDLAFGGFEFPKSPLFPLVFVLAVVFLFNPVRNRVQKFIDRVFYRLEYDYQETVQKISESMRTLMGLDDIGRTIMSTALDTMFIDSGCMVLRKRDESEFECLIPAGEKDEGLVKSSNQRDDKLDDHLEAENSTVPTPDQGPSFQVEQSSKKHVLQGLTFATDEPLIQKMSEQKNEVTIYDIEEDPFFKDTRDSCKKVFEQLEAILFVPLIYEDNLTGLISLGRKKSGKFYRREDINLLNTLANQGAVAIENARMLEEVIEKERMEEELSIAKDLQLSMLPAECPQMDGFEIAAYSASAKEVGGDFYDFIDMGAEKAGLLIGDVTGKSVSGALVMSASRTLFRTLAEYELSVKNSMIRANQRLKKDVKTGMFVALLYVVLSAQDKKLSLCSAGQTQPIVVSAKRGESSLVQTKGDTFPLGIIEEAAYEETHIQLEVGDKIILYTDGIVEAMNEEGEMFGFDRLLAVTSNGQNMTSKSMLENIKDRVDDFAGSASQHDDITIIVIQVT